MRTFPDYAVLAQNELDCADAWANKDGIELATRKRIIDSYMERAMVYALLSISQEVSKLPFAKEI